jgi:sugar lactone lactonase YvrE
VISAVLLASVAPWAITAHADTLSVTYLRTLGGPGHAAMYPSGMEIAPNGNVIIADTGNDQVAEYTPAGTQVWRVGTEGSGPTGKSTLVQFQQPRDVGVDAAGDVFVADNGNGRVVELNSSGGYVTKWKSNPSGSAAPIGITVSNTTTSLPGLPAGQRVYVSDGNRSQITVWTTTGTFISTITSQGACALNRMRDAAADAAGNVYVANYETDKILEFGWSGSAWTCENSWGTKGLASTNGVCDGNGNSKFANPYGVAIGNDPMRGEAIYIADSNDDCIQEFLPNGTWVANIGGPGTTPGTFTQLRRVAVDSAGNVWGADLWGYRVEEFVPSGSGYAYSETIPNPVVPPGSTNTSVFNQVRGLSFDASGDIVAMDTVNQRVVVMDPTGNILYMCGQRGFSSVGDFNWPRGVAVDQSTNHIWIADTKQSDIQIIKNAATCDPVTQFDGTAGSALGAMNYPYSIAIRAADGTVWIADNNNNRIDSWNLSNPTAAGAISTYGTLGAGNGQLDQPTGVGIDPLNGNVLVADSVNNRIVELSDNHGSSISQLATFTNAGPTNFKQPYGVAANAAGDIAVADRGNNRVVVLNPDGSLGTVITGADVTGGGPTSMFNPENVAFGPDGNLYIADTYNDRILVYSLSSGGGGSHFLVAPTYQSTLVGPGLASMYPVDASNSSQYYFVLDAGNYRIVAVNRTTHNIDCTIGGIQGGGPGQIGDARALWFDQSNNDLFVADTPNNRVEVLSFSATACAAASPAAFQFVYQFGTTGTGNGQFKNAYGVAVDAANQWAYVSDGSGWIEKWSFTASSATYLSKFGQGTLNQPRQVSIAPNGEVFVMDARNHQVVIFDSNGNQLATFGGPSYFTQDPRGIDISSDGTMAFATDSGGKRIQVFSLAMSGGQYTGGTFMYSIPSGTGNGAFVGPRGLTVTADNHLLLTDEWGFDVHEFSFVPGTSTFTSTWNSAPTPPAVPGVDAPREVRVAPNGQIYIMDYWNQRIEYMNPDGSNPVAFGFRGSRTQQGALNFAWDMAIQPTTGDIFVANRESNQIEVFTSTGTFITLWGKLGTGPSQFNLPQGIAFAPDGTLYVADTTNGRIEQFSISNANNTVTPTYLTSYGQKGTSGAGFLNQPTGITFTSDGTLWVADTLNKAVQKMSTSGVWTKYTAPISSVQQPNFNVPWGITAAPDGSLWVSVTGNNALVSIDQNDNLIFSATGASIGVPAINGTQTIYPYTVAFDSSDNVYLTDIWNNRVLVLTTHAS